MTFEPEFADRLRDYVSALLKTECRDIYGKTILTTETHLIEEAISFCRGNQTRASALLGITRTTLRSKLRKVAERNPPPKPSSLDELMMLVRVKRRAHFIGQTSLANDLAACIELLMATRSIPLTQAADLLADAIATTEMPAEERLSNASALSVAALRLMQKATPRP